MLGRAYTYLVEVRVHKRNIVIAGDHIALRR